MPSRLTGKARIFWTDSGGRQLATCEGGRIHDYGILIARQRRCIFAFPQLLGAGYRYQFSRTLAFWLAWTWGSYRTAYPHTHEQDWSMYMYVRGLFPTVLATVGFEATGEGVGWDLAAFLS
jgi:hypothetical protein